MTGQWSPLNRSMNHTLNYVQLCDKGTRSPLPLDMIPPMKAQITEAECSLCLHHEWQLPLVLFHNSCSCMSDDGKPQQQVHLVTLGVKIKIISFHEVVTGNGISN